MADALVIVEADVLVPVSRLADPGLIVFRTTLALEHKR